MSNPTPANDTAQVVTAVNAPPPQVCTNLLRLNAPTFNTGSTLFLSAQLAPWPGASVADAYVTLRAPGGAAFSLQLGGTITVAPTPMVTNWTVAPFNGQIFNTPLQAMNRQAATG